MFYYQISVASLLSSAYSYHRSWIIHSTTISYKYSRTIPFQFPFSSNQITIFFCIISFLVRLPSSVSPSFHAYVTTTHSFSTLNHWIDLNLSQIANPFCSIESILSLSSSVGVWVGKSCCFVFWVWLILLFDVFFFLLWFVCCLIRLLMFWNWECFFFLVGFGFSGFGAKTKDGWGRTFPAWDGGRVDSFCGLICVHCDLQ